MSFMGVNRTKTVNNFLSVVTQQELKSNKYVFMIIYYT